MKLLLFAAILSAASASPMLGTAKCSWGPAYWCQSYKQAKECEAIEHCRQKVWIMKPKDACQSCEQVIRELKVILSKNNSEHEMIIFLENLCHQFPGQSASQCKALVDSYVPRYIEEIRDLIADTKKACTLFGLCAAKDQSTIVATVLKNAIPHDNLVSILELGPVLMKKKPSPISHEKPGSVLEKSVKKSSPLKKADASVECVLCEFVMRELDNVISENSTQQEIEEALDKVCGMLPSTIGKECTALVNEYGPAILNILAQELNPSLVCTTLGLCQSKQVSKPVKKIDLKATCVLCEYVMKELDSILGEKSTQEEIENALNKVCGLLPSSLSSECEEFINKYTPALVQLLLQISPSEICDALGMCKSSKTLKEKKQGVPLSTGLSIKCILCEFVMDKLENLVNKNSTETEIREALDEVCDYMPSLIKSSCTDFVNAYTDEIVKFLTEEFAPGKVCTELGFCSGTKHLISTKLKVKSNDYCLLCKLIVNYAKRLLSENATEEEILEEAGKLCDMLPGALRSQCSSLVKQYGKAILDLILKETPEQLCEELGLCTSSLKKVDLKLSGKGKTPARKGD